MAELVKSLNIKNYDIFRTDSIWTKPKKVGNGKASQRALKPRIFQEDEITVTIRQMYDLMIGDSYEIILPNHAKSIVIYEHCIFVVMDDLDRNIIFFKRQAKGWTFVSVLESFLHQSLINRRLRHIFLNEDDIIFVYNNRVRKYDLNTGKLIANQQMRDARSKEYLGKDVMNKFVGRGI